MFERKRRAADASRSVQSHRTLRSGETIPPLPGLLDQLLALRTEQSRASHGLVEDELEITTDWDDEDDEL